MIDCRASRCIHARRRMEVANKSARGKETKPIVHVRKDLSCQKMVRLASNFTRVRLTMVAVYINVRRLALRLYVDATRITSWKRMGSLVREVCLKCN